MKISMQRVPEPELMLDAAQTRAYAEADFDAPHSLCIEQLQRRCPLPERGRALDLGCGPGDISLRLARALPGWSVDALDGSPAMLDLAAAAATRAGLQTRVRFYRAILPHDPPPADAYDLIVSNSLLHHLADPAVLWSSVLRCGRAGTCVFVMDLLRPASDAEARALVARYASSEPDVLQRDFYNSLRAAYRPDEVREQVVAAGLAQFAIDVISDRHLIVCGRL
jgi:SAM-dependent methyltransferase